MPGKMDTNLLPYFYVSELAETCFLAGDGPLIGDIDALLSMMLHFYEHDDLEMMQTLGDTFEDSCKCSMNAVYHGAIWPDANRMLHSYMSVHFSEEYACFVPLPVFSSELVTILIDLGCLPMLARTLDRERYDKDKFDAIVPGLVHTLMGIVEYLETMLSLGYLTLDQSLRFARVFHFFNELHLSLVQPHMPFKLFNDLESNVFLMHVSLPDSVLDCLHDTIPNIRKAVLGDKEEVSIEACSDSLVIDEIKNIIVKTLDCIRKD